jgi:hypothetical protein
MRSQDSIPNSNPSFDQKVLIIISEARSAIEINDSLFASLNKANAAILSANEAKEACSIALDKEKATNALEMNIKNEQLYQTKTALDSEIKRGKFWRGLSKVSLIAIPLSFIGGIVI